MTTNGIAQSVELVEPQWDTPPGVTAFTTSRGEQSAGAAGIEGFNLASHVNDDADRVARHRQALVALAQLPEQPRWLNQVHGTVVVDAGTVAHAPDADASVTGSPGVVCAVLTADCLPVFLADRRGQAVGVAHAGWRGLAAGILDEAVAAMPVPPEQISAAFGPGIAMAAYEVGPEVRDAFSQWSGFQAAFVPSQRPGHWYANLYELAALNLVRLGITSPQIPDRCTLRDAAHWFSYRREGACGRMASIIYRS